MILMNRRHFLKMATLSAGVTLASGPPATAAKTRLRRRYCRTSFGDIAYLDRGKGPAALFLHGWPLNGYHWRDSLTLLSGMRHCIAPDLMGLGHSQVPNQADLSPRSQATMLVAFMDALGIDKADLVSNDSATAIAQLLAVFHPERIRSLLITNGDVHTNSPPAALLAAIEQAREGKLIFWFEKHLDDLAFARSPDGLGGITYTNPSFVTAELLEAYLRPLVSSPERSEI